MCELRTRPESALIYRLSGDYNPVHADPAVARSAGFERPILHGLCSFGVSGVALLKTLCGWNPARLKEIGCRFSSPVYPGETLRVDTGCVAGYQPTVDFDIQFVGGIKTALFGGEGLFFAKLTGPGTVWLQSLPFSRLASRVFAAAPQMGGSREQGSILPGVAGGGILGGILGGDDE